MKTRLLHLATLVVLGSACTFGAANAMSPPQARPRDSQPMPHCVAFSPDGAVLAIGCNYKSPGNGRSVPDQGMVILQEAESGRRISQWVTEDEVRQLRFSEDGQRLLMHGVWTMYHGGLPPTTISSLRWFDVRSKQQLVKMQIFDEPVMAADGTAMALRQSAATTICRVFSQAPPIATDLPSSIKAISSQGRFFAIPNQDAIAIHDLIDKKIAARLKRINGSSMDHLLLSRDGKMLICATRAGISEARVEVWNVGKQAVGSRFDLEFDVGDLILSNDESYLGVCGQTTYTNKDGPCSKATIWDLQQNRRIWTQTNLAWRHPLAFAPDSRRLALVENTGKVRIIDLQAQ